jgi:hypothetical protein
MSIKVQIPPQYAGNMVELDQTATGVNDKLLSPPSGRWRAIHNIDDEVVTVYAPENEVYRFIAANGDDRSDVYAPGNEGKLIADKSIISSVSDLELGLTASQSTGGTSGDVTVTRPGGTFSGTAPSFDGITTDANGDITAIAVNGEGTGLEEGDVITFSFINESSVDTGIIITITVAENDLQLAAGFYVLKATTRKQILSLAAGESAYLNASKIEIHAAGDDAKVIAFFG